MDYAGLQYPTTFTVIKIITLQSHWQKVRCFHYEITTLRHYTTFFLCNLSRQKNREKENEKPKIKQTSSDDHTNYTIILPLRRITSHKQQYFLFYYFFVSCEYYEKKETRDNARIYLLRGR